MGKKGYRDFSGTAPWTYVSAGQSHTTSDAMDLEENGGTGDSGYVYMAYRTIVMYNYIDTQGNDERPITNIIIVDFGSSAEIQDVYYDPQGRMYHRVPITSQDGKTNYPLIELNIPKTITFMCIIPATILTARPLPKFERVKPKLLDIA